MRRLLPVTALAALALAGCGSTHRVVVSKPALPTGATAGHRPTSQLVAPTAKLRATAPIEVPAKPKGLSGSYTVAFADGFGSLSAWLAQQTPSGRRGCCNNSNENGDMVAALVKQTPGLLELPCKHETSPLGRPYSCSGVNSLFNWQPGHGQTMVFEVEAQWPSNAGEGQDPGWWSTDPPWTDEIDFFEAWGWGHPEYFAGMPCQLPKAGAGSDFCREIYKPKVEIPTPETGMHTYATVVKPNGELEEWIDGTYRGKLGPISGINTPWMHLILTHALRGSSTSGTTVFAIKRVEVFEDSAHANVGVERGGVAPGTCIAGTSGCGEPTPPPPPPPTTTETTPTPPPAEGPPPAPIELTAKWNGSSTAPSIAVSAPAVPGATGYDLYRAGPNSYGEPGAPWGASHPTPSFANGGAIKYGDRECYWLSAFNSHGQSPLSREVCARAHG